MTFKNQKEEVIEIELTSHGKYLLSKGKFRPEYYAFYDDDILYDSQYAGEEEEQNYAQTRILQETPRARVQTVFTGVETEVTKQIEEARANKKRLKDSFQSTKEKHYALSMPLGTSSVSSDYAPSWDITIYGGKFQQQLTTSSGDHQVLQIPQMNLEDAVYKAEVVETKEEDLRKGSMVSSFETQSFENGMSIDITQADFILEIDELHTDSMRENYDIEIYLVEEEDINGNEMEVLIPLSFEKRVRDRIVDGILLDDEPESIRIDKDETYVEYYFDIEVDKEIDTERLCELGYVTDSSKRGHIRVSCNKVGAETDMDKIYRDLGKGISNQGDDC